MSPAPLPLSCAVSGCECDSSQRTGREDVLHSGVRGKHLAHELLLLLPEVVLQVVRQHHVAGLLHGHYLTEHLQLGPKHSGGQRSVSCKWKPNCSTNHLLCFFCRCFNSCCSIFSMRPCGPASSLAIPV